MIGETLGSYQVVRKLGEGGMGVVYLAEHASIGRKAAIKLLLPELSQNREIVARFFNEARATSLIDDPGLVSIYDFGYHPSGSVFIVMEYIAGESLAARIARDGTMHPDLLLAIARQVAGALGAVHERGIVHRDLKPDNVMLVADRDVASGHRAKVLDFGIAKLAGDSAAPSSHRTRTGVVMGTPAYMSPEQCRGAGDVDARSDVYALGCMMFAMATGRPPFLGEGPGDVIAAHLREAPPSPRTINPRLSPALERTILRALAKRTDERPQTMAELVAELDAVPPAGFPRPPTGGLPYVRRPAPASMTTLGAGTGEIAPPPPPPRTAAVVAATGTALVAGVIVAIALARRPGVEEAAALVAVPDAAPIAITPLAVPEAPPDAAPPVPVPVIVDSAPSSLPMPAPPRARPAKVAITLTSKPSGAVVYDAGGKRRGVTPLRLEIDRAAARQLEIRCRGYHSQRVAVSADAPGTAVRLERDPRVPPASECD